MAQMFSPFANEIPADDQDDVDNRSISAFVCRVDVNVDRTVDLHSQRLPGVEPSRPMNIDYNCLAIARQRLSDALCLDSDLRATCGFTNRTHLYAIEASAMATITVSNFEVRAGRLIRRTEASRL